MSDSDVVKNMIADMGGKENILSYTHCATRMRFQLADESKAQTKKIEGLKGVISVVKAAGQYQVVFGPKVIDIYNEVQNQLGDSNQKTEVKPKKGNVFNALIDFVSSVFTPILYVLIGSGIIKGILSICTSFNWMSPNSGTYLVLNAAGDSLYYFLPMFLAVTCSRKLHTNLFVSLAIGGALVYPNVAAVYGKTIKFMGIPVGVATFKSSVFPIIFAVFALYYLEKFLKKVIPSSVESIFSPLICLFLLVPITIIIFGPLGSFLTNWIAKIYMDIYSFNRMLAGGFIGFFAQAMVVFGIHWGLFPIMFSNIAKYGYDTILAVFGPSIIAQSGAALGIWLRTKNSSMKKIASSATFMGFFGISEPAIYGVTLKFKRAFLMAMIAGGIGGAIAGGAGARATAVAVASVPSFPVYFGHGFVQFVIGYFTAFFLAAILTYFFGYDKKVDLEGVDTTKDAAINSSKSLKEANDENKAVEEWKPLVTESPVSGKVTTLDKVNDPVFATGSLGKGFAVKPDVKKQTVSSPVSGVVTATYPNSKHAYGITTEDGRQFLIHVGINTVDLKGEGFSDSVEKNARINAGDPLCTVDFDLINQKKYDPTVIVALINTTPHTVVKLLKDDQVSAKDEVAEFNEKG